MQLVLPWLAFQHQYPALQNGIQVRQCQASASSWYCADHNSAGHGTGHFVIEHLETIGKSAMKRQSLSVVNTALFLQIGAAVLLQVKLTNTCFWQPVSVI